MNYSFFSMSDNEWPLARIIFNRNPENYEEFEEFLEVCRNNLYTNKRGRFYLLVDPSELTTLNPVYIYKIVNFMREMEPLTKEYMIELGLLVKSPIIRTIVDCIISLKTPVVPWNIFSYQYEMDNWILELQNGQLIFPI